MEDTRVIKQINKRELQDFNRILGGLTGAAAGYYGGQMVPGVAQSGFKGIPGLPTFFRESIRGREFIRQNSNSRSKKR
jgi:hypothetical protein